MPIRINLLAEQQAAEEMRRRDPVKRATWAIGLVIGVLLLYSAYLQIQLMAAMRHVYHYESQWKALEKEYSLVTSNIDRTAESERRVYALQSLATNRFLWGPAFNALQYTMVDDIQIQRLKSEQSYTVTEGTKASTNRTGATTKAKPPSSREKIVMTLEGNDYFSRPGEQIGRFQERLNNEPFFKTNLQKSELTGRSPPQAEVGNPSRAFVHFILDCHFQEKVR